MEILLKPVFLRLKGDKIMLIKENKISQRDAFWTEIYKIAKEDKDVVVVSADMGAPALDDIRKDFSSQFVNAGIAEQNATLIASGLSSLNKKVYTYAIAPFITLRCLEQIRVNNSIMKIPITIVGVGVAFGYEDSGPTHHLIEDIAVMRSMPEIDIYSVTDSVMAKQLAHITYESKRSNYIRIERQLCPNIYEDDDKFTEGLSVLVPNTDNVVLATGNMVFVALEIANEINGNGGSLGVIDVYKIPVDEKLLIEKIGYM